MKKVKYLAAGPALAVLLVAVAGTAYAYGRSSPTADEDGAGSTMGTGRIGPTMDGGMMSGGTMSGGMMGSSDEEGPFDLRFIDRISMHHRGAIVSSGHMISAPERPEVRRLARNVEESQSEQTEQMQARRDEWYPDAGRASGTMGPAQMDGSMQEMMGGDMADAMFLRMIIPHHRAAVGMSEEALEEAEHPELEELARQIIEEQSAEIELMQGYLGEIGS